MTGSDGKMIGRRSLSLMLAAALLAPVAALGAEAKPWRVTAEAKAKIETFSEHKYHPLYWRQPLQHHQQTDAQAASQRNDSFGWQWLWEPGSGIMSTTHLLAAQSIQRKVGHDSKKIGFEIAGLSIQLQNLQSGFLHHIFCIRH